MALFCSAPPLENATAAHGPSIFANSPVEAGDVVIRSTGSVLHDQAPSSTVADAFAQDWFAWTVADYLTASGVARCMLAAGNHEVWRCEDIWAHRVCRRKRRVPASQSEHSVTSWRRYWAP